MDNIRKGEINESPYRSGRYYTVANEWYFSVRETKDCGPYESKESAENALKLYLQDIAHFKVNENILTLSDYQN